MSVTTKWPVIALSATIGLSCGLSMAHVQQPRRTNTNPEPHCVIANLLPDAQTKVERAEIRIFRMEWLAHARVCKIGGFTIVVPANQSSGPIIRIYKGRKPIFLRTRGESFLYSPAVPNGRIDLPAVNVWHPKGGRITRLYYDVRNHGTHVTVGDLNFDGTPDVRLVWNGYNIREAYGWYKGRWHELRDRKLFVDGHWRPAHFSGATWKLTDGTGAHTRRLCAAMSGSSRSRCRASLRTHKPQPRSLSPRIKRSQKSDLSGPQ